MTTIGGAAPFWLDPASTDVGFPDVELALREPDGLLAIGGDLSRTRLIEAYRRGIFPWYGPGQPILWWSPDPRLTLQPGRLRISRSLSKILLKGVFEVTLNRNFPEVIRACAAPRNNESGTWITPEMEMAYIDLYRHGYAHSVECWLDGELAGGLYGVAVGRVFFGESMFTRVSNASKVALAYLARQLHQWDFELIDCQVHTPHLVSLGATAISRREFTAILHQGCALPAPAWPRDRILELF